MKVEASYQYGRTKHTTYFDEPDHCPLCKHAIKPTTLYSDTYQSGNNRWFLVNLYLCKHCYRVFVALFRCDNDKVPVNCKLEYIGPKKFSEQAFDKHISALSPSFVKIYNQAKEAETMGLDEMAGIGYRKALEFLIKDYLIHSVPEDTVKIKGMELGNCIANKVNNEKLKIVASRSAWLGNDQTHYVQRFEDRDINDLKCFIDAVVYWVSMELITEDALLMEKQDCK